MSLSIGLFVPTPVPPARGGCERLADGLERALNRVGKCTRVDIPVDERTWEGVLQGYREFYEADTSTFDVVISTKGPSYLIQHPRHICYMVQRPRVFYDMYEEQGEEHARRRDLIHKLDTQALTPPRTQKLYCIGKTVQKRLEKFGGLASEVIYPGTDLDGFYCSGYEHFLFVSRLHRWKRGDLAIRAFRKTTVDAPFIIAGSGPDEEAWKELAAGDSRIRFTGQVSQEQLYDLYARALAVIFPPINEDFGYITIESMLSRTPVITCSDSGEPAEFVEHCRTGLIAEPNEDSLAEQIQYCVDRRAEVPRWGEAGYERVKDITWENAVERLLESVRSSPPRPKSSWVQVLESKGYSSERPLKMVVTDNQILTPAIGGGRVRIAYLYRYFPECFEIDYVGTYDYLSPDHVAVSRPLAENYRENLVPMTALHWLHLARAQARCPDQPLGDVLFADLVRYTPKYERTLKAFSKDADVVIAAHPWMTPFLDVRPDQLLIYDSQNCEAVLKKELLKRVPGGRELARRVFELEQELCQRADLIFICSEKDGQQFQNDFGIGPEKMVEIPNGVDALRCSPATEAKKQAASERLQIETPHVAVFVGSAYGPNTEAVQFIVDRLMERFPDVTFLILGNVRDSYLEYRERQGIEYLPAVSRTGLGDGWFAGENWGRPVRWTGREALIGVVPNGASLLAFDCLSNVRKKLDVYCNREKATTITIEPEQWVSCEVPLAPGVPNLIQLRVSKTHPASSTDPRQLGVAVTNLRRCGPQGDEAISLEGRAGSDVVGDRLCLMGVVDEETKDLAFQAADVALNPIFRGSGSNIKMFDYLAAGLPVVTTPVGARGIGFSGEKPFVVVDEAEFASAMRDLLDDAELRERIGQAGRALAVERYDWRVIADRAGRAIEEALIRKRGL
jgi:glycosyltransferase involved in cell wall biosynthesis